MSKSIIIAGLLCCALLPGCVVALPAAIGAASGAAGFFANLPEATDTLKNLATHKCTLGTMNKCHSGSSPAAEK